MDVHSSPRLDAPKLEHESLDLAPEFTFQKGEMPLAGGRLSSHGEQRRKAAEDQAPRIEGRLAARIETAILVHLLFRSEEALLVRPHLPGEDDLLAGLRRDRAAEIRRLAVGQVILPTLDDFEAAMGFED